MIEQRCLSSLSGEKAGRIDAIFAACLIAVLKRNQRLARLVNTNIVCLLTTHRMAVWIVGIQTDTYSSSLLGCHHSRIKHTAL